MEDTEPKNRRLRIWGIFAVLLVLALLPFLLIGEQMEQWFSFAGAQVWLSEHFGKWAWLGGMSLLLMDLFLPIPGTTVMSVMGFIYGTFWGGVINATGSIGSGWLTYEAARYLGWPIAKKLAGEETLAQAHAWFEKDKAFGAVMMSRWLPLLPEAISALAGLSKMPRKKFLLALVLGSTPLSFVFAWVGEIGNQHATMALVLSAVIPLILYLASLLWKLKNQR